LENLGIDGRIIVKIILEEEGCKVLSGFIWRRIGTNGDSCENGNTFSGSIKSPCKEGDDGCQH
jgi:hypothetical protein